MGLFSDADVTKMIFYALVPAIPSVIIIAICCSSRMFTAEERNTALLLAPLLVFFFGGIALAAVLPCTDPPAAEGTGAAAALLVFSGYAWLQLARYGRGKRRYWGLAFFIVHVCIALIIAALFFSIVVRR